jgi:hypothetical protein
MEEDQVTAMSTLAKTEVSDPSSDVRVSYNPLDPARQVRLIIHAAEHPAEQPWWAPEVEARLQHLATLDDDWNSHGAMRPQPESMLLAVRIIAALVGHEAGRPLPQIVPTRHGGLQLEWHVPGAKVEITTDPGDAVWAYVTIDGANEDGPLTEQEANVIQILNQAAQNNI